MGGITAAGDGVYRVFVPTFPSALPPGLMVVLRHPGGAKVSAVAAALRWLSCAEPPPAGPERRGADPRPDHRRQPLARPRPRLPRFAPRSRGRAAARRRAAVAAPGDAPARRREAAVAGVAPPMRFTGDGGEPAVVLECDTEPAEVDLTGLLEDSLPRELVSQSRVFTSP